jgi:ABC-type ATPase involved in cell division
MKYNMDLINFTIPNRNGTLCLKLDKPFTFVFGGNGAGKSTCAKKIKELDKNCILFDSSFVSKTSALPCVPLLRIT